MDFAVGWMEIFFLRPMFIVSINLGNFRSGMVLALCCYLHIRVGVGFVRALFL